MPTTVSAPGNSPQPTARLALQGKTALVTGGASGIGEAIVRRFHAEGAAVALFDRNPVSDKLREELVERSRFLQGDVSEESQVRDGVTQTFAAFGSLDILVNCAGVEESGTVVELSSATWDHVMAVNLRSAFLFSKYAIPLMQAGGAIIHISSIDALVSYAGNAAYDASKAGLLALTRTMAIDHGRAGIRVNAICPGYIDTPLLAGWFARTENPGQTRRDVSALHPLGRIGRADEVAAAALFLASNESAFITGTHLVVDGGLTARGL